MGLFLVTHLCSINMCLFPEHNILFWLLKPCVIIWDQGAWYHQLCSFFLKVVLAIQHHSFQTMCQYQLQVFDSLLLQMKQTANNSKFPFGFCHVYIKEDNKNMYSPNFPCISAFIWPSVYGCPLGKWFEYQNPQMLMTLCKMLQCLRISYYAHLPIYLKSSPGYLN